MSRRWIGWVVGGAIAAATAVVRLLAPDFANDDYLFLAIGRQIAVFGDWPVRDLVEEGDPLHNVVSALLQWYGHRLAGEVLFDIGVIALAAATTFVVAARLAGSRVLGAGAAILTVLAWPRLYDYPKAALAAATLWLCSWYARRPGMPRVIGLGVFTAVAFLFRHDFGAYAAVAAAVAILASSQADLLRTLGVYALTAFIGVLPYLLFVQHYVGVGEYLAAAQRFSRREISRSDDRRPRLSIDWSRPWLERRPAVPVKIRWSARADSAARAAAERRYHLTHGRADEGRTWSYALDDSSEENQVALLHDPLIEDTANIDRTLGRGEPMSRALRLRAYFRTPPRVAIAPGVLNRGNAVAWLYLLFMVLPWLSLALAIAARLGYGRPPHLLREALPVIAFCAVAAPLLLRGNLYDNGRIADFCTPGAILAAWLAGAAWRAPRSRPLVIAARVLVLVAILITVSAVGAYGPGPRVAEGLTVLIDPAARLEETKRIRTTLLESPPVGILSPEKGTQGAVDYLRACTAPTDRVLIYGFFPDVLYASGRGTAADRAVVLRGFWTEPAEQRRTVAVLARTRPAVALVEASAGGGSLSGHVLDATLPIVEQHVASHLRRVATTTFGSSTGNVFDVWVDPQRPVISRFAPFDLPCLR